jgi:hypothetical protein
MTDTQQSVPTLQPVPDAQNLLVQGSDAGACCGGTACSI